MATKFRQPSPPLHLVERPQLLQRLSEDLADGRRLALISAPAGFGKTTCAGEIESMLDSGRLPPLEVLTTTLINELLQAERKFLLVLAALLLKSVDTRRADPLRI